MSDALSEIQKTVDHIESDLIHDRTEFDKKFNQILSRLSVLESTVSSMESRLPRTEAKIADAVSNGVSKGLEEVTREIKNSTLVIPKKSSLWEFIKSKL